MFFKTPNLDLLAAQGMRFTGAFLHFLTGTHYELGQFSDENEGGQMPIPETTPTLAKMLKNAGYQTAMIGKWGLGMNETTGSPLIQGFDYYYGYLDQKQAHNYYPTHLWENDKISPLNNEYFLVHTPIEKGSNQNKFNQFKGKDYAPDKMVEKAVNFIETSSINKPFFLYYPSPIPHVSLQIPDSLINSVQRINLMKRNYGDKGYTPHQYPKSAYAAMITHLDSEVGKIWDAVKAKGEEENTLILFSSDNGPTFAGGVDATFFNSTNNLRGLKMDVYEGGIRIPFIAYWKNKIKSGQHSDLISGHWDMFNTFSELSGQKELSSDGISLVPELLGKEGQKEHEFIYFEYPEKRGQIAIRIGNWKGVKVDVKTNFTSKWELYNLKNDIQETNNVANKYPEILKKLDSIQKLAHRHPHIREWEFVDPKFVK